MAINNDTLQTLFTDSPGGVTLRVKVIAGASRTRLAGIIGDRLKITVDAAPEAGKANQAVCKRIAKLFQIPPRDAVITLGHTQPLKSIQLVGLALPEALRRLRQHLTDNTTNS